MNISTHIHFVKRRDPRKRRSQDRANTGEREWDQTDVRLPFVRIDRQSFGDELLQLERRDLPVQKEEMMPILMHEYLCIRLQSRRDTIDGVRYRHGRWKEAMAAPRYDRIM